LPLNSRSGSISANALLSISCYYAAVTISGLCKQSIKHSDAFGRLNHSLIVSLLVVNVITHSISTYVYTDQLATNSREPVLSFSQQIELRSLVVAGTCPLMKKGSYVVLHRRTSKACTPCLIDLLQSSYHSFAYLGSLGSRFFVVATGSKMKPSLAATPLTTTPRRISIQQKAKEQLPNRGIEPRPCRCFSSKDE
jgi:hypothetical protein